MDIENKNRKPKGNTVLLTIIAIATLLVAVIGATFAYFSVTIVGNEQATSTIVKTATLGITYDSGQSINAENLFPGVDIPSKTFSVSNTGEVAMTYKITWSDITNTLGTPAELKYSVTGTVTTGEGTTKTLAETQAPTTSGDISQLTNITIQPGATHTFALKILFPDTGLEQNANQGKTFSGKIQIVAEKVGELD